MATEKMLTTKMKPMVRAIRDYYTRDQARECVEAWNSLTEVEQAQHILACTPFRAQVIKSQEVLRQESELQRYIRSEQWQQQMKELNNDNCDI